MIATLIAVVVVGSAGCREQGVAPNPVTLERLEKLNREFLEMKQATERTQSQMDAVRREFETLRDQMGILTKAQLDVEAQIRELRGEAPPASATPRTLLIVVQWGAGVLLVLVLVILWKIRRSRLREVGTPSAS